MGRKVLSPDYGRVAEWLYESMPPEIREKFIQAFLRVDSPEKAVLKLVKTKEQQKRLLEFLQRNLDDGGIGVDSIEEAVKKLQERQNSKNNC